MSHRHYPQLDGLRGVAIAMVVIGHLLEFGSSAYRAGQTLGALGVLLFFVLSGFLITDILFAESKSTGWVNLTAFYTRRALRLLPALLVFLAAVTLLKVAGQLPRESWKSIVASLLYLRNIFGSGDALGHLWSLSLEEQFYVTWPVAFVLLGNRRLRGMILFLTLMAIWRTVAIRIRLSDPAGGAFYERPWYRYDSILYGCLAAVVWQADPDRVRAAGRFFYLPLLAPLLFGVAMIGDRSPGFSVSLTAQSVLACAILISVITTSPGRWLYQILTSRFLVWAGRLSYSLYLWQQLFLVVRDPPWGVLRTFPVNLAASTALALLSHYVVEKPFLKMKGRLTPPEDTAWRLRSPV